jgi:replicative DNA helicase
VTAPEEPQPLEPEDPDADRPKDITAEQSVLGAMMLDPDAAAQVATILTAEDFYRPTHADLFATICSLAERGRPTDPLAVAAAYEPRALLRVGGAPYLHTLISEVPTAANAAYYAEIVADRALRARMLDAGTRIRQLATQGGIDDTTAVVERAQEAIEALSRAQDRDDDDGAWLASSIDDELNAWEMPDAPGLSTGYSDLDDLIGGLKPGQFIIVAARPGLGKSILATDWARHAAEHGAAVLHFSLEMSRRELMQRLVSAKAKVRLRDITQRSWTEYERGLMSAKARELHETCYRIEDGPNVTMATIRAKARAMARSSTGLDLLIVDYLQLLESGGRVESRQQEVSEFSRGLKILAKELGVPVVAIAQLNRGPEQRTDHRPMLSDLRESGSLEQDADLVLLINRPDAWERDDPRAGEADLIVAKHRNGPTATITVAHQLHYARFADIARGLG